MKHEDFDLAARLLYGNSQGFHSRLVLDTDLSTRTAYKWRTGGCPLDDERARRQLIAVVEKRLDDLRRVVEIVKKEADEDGWSHK